MTSSSRRPRPAPVAGPCCRPVLQGACRLAPGGCSCCWRDRAPGWEPGSSRGRGSSSSHKLNSAFNRNRFGTGLQGRWGCLPRARPGAAAAPRNSIVLLIGTRVSGGAAVQGGLAGPVSPSLLRNPKSRAAPGWVGGPCPAPSLFRKPKSRAQQPAHPGARAGRAAASRPFNLRPFDSVRGGQGAPGWAWQPPCQHLAGSAPSPA